MRFSIAALCIAWISAVTSATAQQTTSSPLRELDLRLPLRGEPEEVIGPTMHAIDALAVDSARIEPLDSIVSRDATFHRATKRCARGGHNAILVQGLTEGALEKVLRTTLAMLVGARPFISQDTANAVRATDSGIKIG